MDDNGYCFLRHHRRHNEASPFRPKFFFFFFFFNFLLLFETTFGRRRDRVVGDGDGGVVGHISRSLGTARREGKAARRRAKRQDSNGKEVVTCSGRRRFEQREGREEITTQKTMSMSTRKRREQRKSERSASPSSSLKRSADTVAATMASAGNDENNAVMPRAVLESMQKNRARDVFSMAAFCLLPTVLIIVNKGFVDGDGVSVRNMDSGAMKILLLALFTSLLAYKTTIRLIPIVARRTLGKRNMYGLDINKKGTKMGEIAIPEALGLASGCAVLVALVVGRTLHTAFILRERKQGKLENSGESEHNAALATIGFMLFLGFVDDVLDLPWRAKMILPGFAATTLAQSYQGSTSIVVPHIFRENVRLVLDALDSMPIVRDILPTGVDKKSGLMDVGYMYIAFIWLLAVFLSNAINIHAGLNGLECGQSLVIASGIIVLNVWSLLTDPTSDVVVGPHVFSLLLIAPFFAATVGLLKQNWYPSAVFVGDSYTYFAGMTLAVAGILGHFSETLLLFCLPQVVNFLYSIPQLFKLVPCPRHRLPRFDTQTGLLSPSKATETRYNMNLVTLFLRVFGKTTERKLCLRLLAFQVACVVFTFAARYVFIAFVHWK